MEKVQKGGGVSAENQKVHNSKCRLFWDEDKTLQKPICFIIHTSDYITYTSVNMVRRARRASMVIMSQVENNINTETINDSNNVNHTVLVTALGGARLYMFTILAKAAVINFLKTWFSALLMESSEDGQNVKQSCYELNS